MRGWFAGGRPESRCGRSLPPTAAACLSYQGALTTLSPLLEHGMSRSGKPFEDMIATPKGTLGTQ
jgi:hypothetical protein